MHAKFYSTSFPFLNLLSQGLTFDCIAKKLSLHCQLLMVSLLNEFLNIIFLCSIILQLS